MEKLITVKDVKERYGCSTPTARKYIRQCNPHMENPLATYEWAFAEWEQGRIVISRMSKRVRQNFERHMRGERIIVPRKRG